MYYFIEPKYFGKRDIIMPKETGNIFHPNVCPVCGGNRSEPERPVRFVLRGEPCDYYQFWSFIFVSESFKSMLEELNVTGYKLVPAKTAAWNLSDNEDEFPSYYEMIITGRCGLMRDMNGTPLPHCEKCGRSSDPKEDITGVSFEPDDYDDSDIFVFENRTNFPIIDSKLKKEISARKLSNCKFTDIRKYTVKSFGA